MRLIPKSQWEALPTVSGSLHAVIVGCQLELLKLGQLPFLGIYPTDSKTWALGRKFLYTSHLLLREAGELNG